MMGCFDEIRRDLHSQRAWMIASISLSWVGYLLSGLENILEVKAIGRHVSSCDCSKRAPEATSKASVKRRYGESVVGSLRTGCEESILFNSSKAFCWSSVQLYGLDLVRTVNGAITVE